MKIRGNTVGTPIKPKQVLVKSENLTPEEQSQARQKIGAMQNGVADTDLDMQHHNLKKVKEITLDFGLGSSVTMSNYVDEGNRVHFAGNANNGFGNVGLSNIADGKKDNDAATVGQLKAAVNPINDSVKDLAELMSDFNQDICDILQEVQNAGAVKKIDNQDSTARVPLYDLENGVYVLKGYFKLNNTNSSATNANVSLSTETLSIVSGSTETKYVTLIFGSGKVARYEIAAESYKSYPVRNILNTPDGFELLAETILTEDASLISWTQTKDGKPLTDYKDFFIYWVGKFEVDVNNQAWICRANSGQMFYTYTFINKGTANCAFWWEIKELYNDNSNTIWLANFPSTYITSLPREFDYYNQGLHGSNKAQSSDLCFNPSGYKIQSLQFGSLSDGAKMVAGSKAILLGRAR